MKNWGYFFVFFVWLCSCKSVELQPRTTDTVTRITDSTATRTATRDTVLTFPRDSVSLSARFRELTSTPLTKRSQTGNLSVSLRKVGDNVEASCDTEHLELIIQLQDRIIELYRKEETTTREQTTLTETKMPAWAKIPVYVGCIVILLGFVALFMYIRSMPQRILKKTLTSN